MTDISALTGNSTDGTSTRRSLADNFDNFLTMLTTQLENQDPLSPMDSTEFTNQLVAFSGLEQQIAGNEKLDNLYIANKAVEAATAVQYLGKTVEIASNVTFLADGEATISYILPEEAKEATITLYNSEGELVHTLEADTDSGRNEFTWDGKNEQDVDLEAGTYAVVVTALDSEDESIQPIPVYANGTVNEIINDNSETYILVNDMLVSISDVKAITGEAI